MYSRTSITNGNKEYVRIHRSNLTYSARFVQAKLNSIYLFDSVHFFKVQLPLLFNKEGWANTEILAHAVYNLGSTCNPLKYSHMQFYNLGSTCNPLKYSHMQFYNLGSTCNPLKYSHMQFYNFELSTLRNLDDVLVHLYRRIVCLKRLLDLIAIVTSVLITWSLFSGKNM